MKKWFKRGLTAGLCISMCVCPYVQARIVPFDEVTEVEKYYHTSEEHQNRFMKIEEIAVSETGEITFLEEHPLSGTEEDVTFSDLVYVVDENTDVCDTKENFEKFKNGKLTWVNVGVTKADIENVYTKGLRRVHVKYLGWLSDQIVIYPTAEEKEMGRILSEKGIMIGDETGIAPYRILTRAELAKIAVMLYNPELKESNYSDLNFSDVSSEHWAYKYIEYAANKLRVMNGYDDGSFCPDARATTEEAIKVFACILGVDNEETDFPDGYIMAAEGAGLLDGIDLNYGQDILRCETAALAMNVLNIWGVVTD